MKVTIETRTALGLGLAGVIILGLAHLSYQNTRGAAGDSHWVWHTHEFLEQIEDTLEAIEHAQSENRNYIITGVESHLEIYRDARSQIREHVANLKRMTSDNPYQQQRLTSMESRSAASLDLLEQGVELRRREGFESANRFVQSGRSADQIDQIRRMAVDLREEEEGLLKQREASFELRTNRALPLVAAVVLFSFFVLGTVYYVVARDIRERARTRKKLEESEARLRGLLEAAPLGVLEVDTQGHILLANAEAERIFGYGQQELLGMPVEGLMPERFQKAHEKHRSGFMSDAHPRLMGSRPELFGRRKDGSEFPAEIALSTVESADGTLVISIIRDITERKRAERAVRRATEEFQDLYNNAPCGYHSVDQNGSFVRMNDTELRWLGYAREEIVHKLRFPDITTAQGRRIFEETFPKVMKEGSASGVEIDLVRKDGTTMPVLLSATSVRDADGRFLRTRTTVFDISERKQMEEALRRYQEGLEQKVKERTALLSRTNETLERQVEENRKTLEALRESQQRLSLHMLQTPLAAIEWNLEGETVEWNPAAERMFGYTRAEALGRRMSFIIPESTRELTEGIWSDLIAQRGGTRSINENVTKDGKMILCEWYNTPLVDRNGRVVGVASLANDLTEYRKLEEQFRQAQKMEAVGLLAGGVAHDFNNMLGVIMGYSELLLEGFEGKAPLRSQVEQIRKTAERAASLTRQLLAFSRKQILQPTVLNLNAVVEPLSNILRRTISEDVELVLSLSSSLGSVKVDRGQIEQILMNLAVNARDAMPQGGKLIIETADRELDETYAAQHSPVRPGSYVLLSVTDTGCGMNETTMSRIFEPFFTTKELGKGTGLGLAIVYGVVKQSGGYIWVYSEPGKGTAFKIYFPRVHEPASALDGPRQEEVLTPASGAILLVEDDAGLRELASTLLRGSGYTVSEAAHPQTAIEIANRLNTTLDLLLTDMVMPGMSGIDLAEKLRESRPQLRVLYMSGYPGDRVTNLRAVETESVFIQKPFSKKLLLAKVRDALRTSKR